jgi:hypothetical protein
VQFASLPFVARRNLFVRPGTVSDGSFKQRTIFEAVRENRLEEVQVRNRFWIFQDALNYSKRRKLVEKLDALPALERSRGLAN